LEVAYVENKKKRFDRTRGLRGAPDIFWSGRVRIALIKNVVFLRLTPVASSRKHWLSENILKEEVVIL
jgi:hypothetical protein